MSHRPLDETRYELWSRLCAIADEANRIVDDWHDFEPDIAELHRLRCTPSDDSACDSQLTFDDLPW